MCADGLADQGGDGGRGERGQGQRALSRPAGQRTEGVGVRGQFVGAVGDHEEQREVFGARGEGGEPAEGLGVGPVGVVEDEDDRGALDDEVGEHPVEPVAQTLGVGRDALFRGAESEGRADDGVPTSEGGAQLLLGGAGELGLDELAGDVEGLALLLFAAPGGEDGAVAGEGAAAQFGEQGGLAESGGAGEGEERATRVRPGTGELVQGFVDDREFGIAFDHRAPCAGPAVRHGWYPPGLFGGSAYARAQREGSQCGKESDLLFPGASVVYGTGREVLQDGHGLGGPVGGHEEVIVVVAGDDIAAQTVCAEFGGEGGGEPDGVEGGVDPQGDPAGRVVVGEAGRVGVLLAQYQGEALGFEDGGDGGGPGGDGGAVDGAEDVPPLVQLGPHAAQEFPQIVLSAHAATLPIAPLMGGPSGRRFSGPVRVERARSGVGEGAAHAGSSA